MKPYGNLMVEHRLIERMAGIIEKKLENGTAAEKEFLEKVIEFFTVYSDECHHKKEEDMLFYELKKRKISEEHAEILEKLEKEHSDGRKIIGELKKEKENLPSEGSKARIYELLSSMFGMYLGHIKTEDRNFFIPVMSYFSEKEQDSMAGKFAEFDKSVDKEKYRKMVEELEK